MGGMFLVKFAVNLHLSVFGHYKHRVWRECLWQTAHLQSFWSCLKPQPVHSNQVLICADPVRTCHVHGRCYQAVVALRERPGLHQDSPANIHLHSKVDSVFRDGRSFEGVCINKMSATS